MPSDSARTTLERAARDLSELRHFPGTPKEFWPRLLGCLAHLSAASHVTFVIKDAAPPGSWKKIGEWSANEGPSRFLTAFVTNLENVADHGAQDGQFFFPLEQSPARGTNHFIVAVRLKLLRPEDTCVAAFLLSEVSEAAAQDTLLRLHLAADTPQSYQINQASRQASTDVQKFATTLDLMVLINAEKRFLGAALALCNGLATHYNCDRVSLGWLEGGYIKLRAISRTEKFDRQMAAARALEIAMEEALDQDEEIVCPPPEEANVVTRDHEKFLKEQAAGNICSVPLRVDDKPVAVLTCERQRAPFTALELQQFRLACDQAARRLSELKHHDRWFGARWAVWLKEKFAKVIGPEHTWAKVLAAVVTALLVVLFFVPFNFRVEGNFILRSDEVAYLTAPFEGYLKDVFVRVGDAVPKDGKLIGLNTADMQLEEYASVADVARYQRESEKARATKNLADMRINQALADQSKARLDLIRYRLNQAVLKAPFLGAVVEGDLRERIGAPVKQGEALFKFARIDTLYVEAEVNERDIHEILNRKTGEIAFVSQPKLKYPVRLVTIEPAAVPKTDGNVFLVRLAVDGGPQPWWRPGMSGLCKLNVEKRTLFWILTHRTVDFLRLKLWW